MKRAFALALTLLALGATPRPLPTPNLPKTAMHSEFLVEVNAKGQVVRVKSAKGTGGKDPFFNAQTLGNVLQMWIRHPDGSAQVGLYRVTYDYNPKTHKIKRGIALVSVGGDWANSPGAATVMIQDAKREQQEQAKRESKKLPPLKAIIGPTSSPSARP